MRAVSLGLLLLPVMLTAAEPGEQPATSPAVSAVDSAGKVHETGHRLRLDLLDPLQPGLFLDLAWNTDDIEHGVSCQDAALSEARCAATLPENAHTALTAGINHPLPASDSTTLRSPPRKMRLWGFAGVNVRTQPRDHARAPDIGERLETELALGIMGRGDRSQVQLGWIGDDTWRLGFQIRF